MLTSARPATIAESGGTAGPNHSPGPNAHRAFMRTHAQPRFWDAFLSGGCTEGRRPITTGHAGQPGQARPGKQITTGEASFSTAESGDIAGPARLGKPCPNKKTMPTFGEVGIILLRGRDVGNVSRVFYTR
jgi:hypothetical protein